MPNGSSILLECLRREGVEVFFGYPGGVVLPIYDEMVRVREPRHVLVRHEENACFAADGFARASGRVGVCMATSGPGATNLVTGLVNSMMDSIPVVAITGQVSTKLIGNDAFQEADTVGITRPCTKHNYLVKSLAELPHAIKEAFHIAASGRPGPVLVDLPKDILQGIWPGIENDGGLNYPDFVDLPGYKPNYEGHPGQIKKAATTIWEAKRPVIYAGGGVISAGAGALLEQLSELVEAPVNLTVMGLGAIPSDHPNCQGMLGMHGSYAANQAMVEADLLIAVGVRFDDRVTGKLEAFAKHARIIHIDIDPAEIGKNVKVDVPIVGDCGQVLEKLNTRLADSREQADGGLRNRQERREWLARTESWRREHPYEYTDRSDVIMPQALLEEIQRLTGGDAIVTTDVGQHQMWAAQWLRFNRPRTWITSGGLGAMGYGLPSAIGAQFACPRDTVIAVVGDGGFQMSLPELGTLATENLPVKTIIMNNGYLGMVRQWQDLFYKGRYSSVEFSVFPDCRKLGEAYGIKGMEVRDRALLREALEETLAHDGPVLLDVRVSREENVYPMIPAGGSLSDIILNDEEARKAATARPVAAQVGSGAGEMS
jgi:acetolactate synthase I/II/III large subunit